MAAMDRFAMVTGGALGMGPGLALQLAAITETFCR